MDKIESFRDEFFFLSNFYRCKIKIDGVEYSSGEAAFQAQKCVKKEEKERFVDLRPVQAKRYGKKVELRSDWEEVKVDIMTMVVRAKFTQNRILADKLIATGDAELIEGNNWRDYFWGMCNGKGENNLGKILMEVREEVKKLYNKGSDKK